MAVFDDFLDEVLAGAKQLARKDLAGAVRAAEQDTRAFLKKAKDNLSTWTTALQAGELDEDEFEDLVHGQKDLIVLATLTQKGIAAARLQRFRDALIDLVIKSALKAFL